MRTPFPSEIQAQIDDFKLLTVLTNDVLNIIEDFIKDYNANNNLNRIEKIGDLMFSYSTKMTEQEIAEGFSACKPSFDNIGKLYRIFNASAQDHVVKPLRQIKDNCKGIEAIIKDLIKAKETTDNAATRARSKPDDPEAMSNKTAMETAYNAHIEASKTQLALIEKLYDTFSVSIKTFDLLILQLVVDEKVEYAKMISAIKL